MLKGGMTNLQLVSFDPGIPFMDIPLLFVGEVGAADLVMNASPAELVLDSDAQRVEAGFRVDRLQPGAVHVIPPEGREVGGVVKEIGCAGRFQFLEHWNKRRMQRLGALAPALLVKVDGQGDGIEVLGWVNIRFHEPDAVVAGDRVTAPEDRLVRLRLRLNIFFQLGQHGVGELARLDLLIEADPKFKGGIVWGELSVDCLLHDFSQVGKLKVCGVMYGEKLAALLVVCDLLADCRFFLVAHSWLFNRGDAPSEVVEAVLPGQLSGRLDALLFQVQPQRAPHGLPSTMRAGAVPVAHSHELRNPGVPLFVCAEPGANGGAGLPLAVCVFGFDLLCSPNVLPDVCPQTETDSLALALRVGTMGEVVNTAAFHEVSHTEYLWHLLAHSIQKNRFFYTPAPCEIAVPKLEWSERHHQWRTHRQQRSEMAGVEHSLEHPMEKKAAPALRPARKHFIERTAYRKGYRVSEDGKTVTSPFRDKPCNPSLNPDGYPWFTVGTDSGLSRRCMVHRLQAYQKFGEAIYEPKIMVRHRDDDRTNAAADNLLLGTSRDNQLDRPAEERIRYAGLAALKFDHAEVRAFYAATKSYKKTMAHFGMKSKGTLHHIIKGASVPQGVAA